MKPIGSAFGTNYKKLKSVQCILSILELQEMTTPFELDRIVMSKHLEMCASLLDRQHDYSFPSILQQCYKVCQYPLHNADEG